MKTKILHSLLSLPTIIIFCLLTFTLWVSKPYIKINLELRNIVKNEILPISEHIISYSIKGHYGNILNLELSNGFDNLSLYQQWQELKKIMDIYDEARWSIVYKNKPEIFDDVDTSFLPDIVANTSNNKYEFDSINVITVNREVYLEEQILYGEDFFEVKEVVFNPPIEVNLVETSSPILASITRYYLIDYEIARNWRTDLYNHPKATQMLDEGSVFFLADARVLLLEYYGDFAKIKLLESQYDKNKGFICWVRKSNIRE